MFTRPGTYTYRCLLHFPGMAGTIVVHPRPAASRLYRVMVGYGSDRSYSDVFFPERLVIHAGTTVLWTDASNAPHTVTFASPQLTQQLRKNSIVPDPQKSGPRS